MVSVKLMIDETSDFFEGCVGMMGEFGTGRMIARDGKTLMEDGDAFGQEWQVLNTETKLFQATRIPQHPQQCILPSPSKTGRRLGQTVTSRSTPAPTRSVTRRIVFTM